MENQRALFKMIAEESARRRKWDERLYDNTPMKSLMKPVKWRRKWRMKIRRHRNGRKRQLGGRGRSRFTNDSAKHVARAGTTTAAIATINSEATALHVSVLPQLPAHDISSLHNHRHVPLNSEEDGGRLVLPCLQGKGDRYLEIAVILDMMQLCLDQSRKQREDLHVRASRIRLAMEMMEKESSIRQHKHHL
ncbi:hypothetical protein KP509_23G041300 [Ceratopteris richardii]|uniref:Uncharacterized protein n=1 Tax=Ceratopteris richardii TaxID=49495 RepID=A0A8T2RZP7_CERRI|nr:hypothetical protein KP509_23G041300 [Ceratopteris richardii]